MLSFGRSRILVLVLACAILAALQGVAQPAEPRTEFVPSTGHAAAIYSLDFSPDGRVLASAGGGTVKLWDRASGRLIRTIDADSSEVVTVAFSPDGRMLAAGGRDKSVKLWDAASGRMVRTFAHTDIITSVSFSQDGQTLLTAARDKTAKLWEVSSGRLLRTIKHSDDVLAAVFVAANALATADRLDRAVKIYDLSTGKLLRTLPAFLKAGRRFLATTRDGTVLATFGDDQGTILWDPATGERKSTWDGLALAGAFSADGRTLALTRGNTNTIDLVDVALGFSIASFAGNLSRINAIAISPDGVVLASGGDAVLGEGDPTVRLFETASGRQLHTLGSSGNGLFAAAVSPDGRMLAFGGDDRSIKLWDATTGKRLQTLGGHADKINTLAFSSDGRLLASGSKDKTVRIWDSATGEIRKTLSVHAASGEPTPLSGYGEIHSVAFSSDGRFLASGNYDRPGNTISIWEVASGRLLHRLRGDTELVFSVAFSPDSRTLAVGTRIGLIMLWDPATGKLQRTLRGHGSLVTSLAFSADGRTLASGSYDNSARVWDVAGGRTLRSFVGHSSSVGSVGLSPDGQTVISGSWDRHVKIWNAGTGRLLHTLDGHSHWVRSVAFGPDARRFVSVSQDGTLNVWRSESGELLATIIAGTGGEWLTITPEGFFDASEKGAEILTAVRGLESFSIDQFYQALYRPDLVREKLSGDPRGLVREAAAKLDLAKVLASGNAPAVSLLSPREGMRAQGERVSAEIEIADRGGGIGRIEWRVNGVTVGVETPSAPPSGQPLRLTRGLVLDDGENEIEVVAYNGQNIVASVPARASVTAQAPAAAGTPARMFVLAVGLNDYADAKFKLTYAVPDAKALGQALTQAGKGLYRSVEVALVQDADVKRAKLDAVFAELAAKVRPSDVFVFFLGGHGKTIDGRYYFIPQDFAIEGAGTKAALDAAVVKQGIAQEQWQAWLARIPARKSVLLFDTCESGSLTGEGKETRALERGAANDRLVHATGRTILTASSDDTDAFEGFRGHGLFTYNVLEALERADTDGNGHIEVAELAAYVYAQVTALSEKVYKQRQVPQVRITGNYSLTKPTQIFAGKEPGIVHPARATHQVTSAAELLVLPAMGARRVRKLDAKTPVTLVKSDAGWTLIAREGRPLGFVATKDLVPIQ